MKTSICLSLKNRCKVENGKEFLELFPKSMKSIAALKDSDDLEVVVTDFMSDDSVLEDWIFDLGLDVNLIKVDEDFSRGKGLNISAANAKYDNLFFTDADILYDDTVFPELKRVLEMGSAWFPIIWYIASGGENYWVKQNGQGISGVTREVFNKTKKWPEFHSYGGEDHDFYYDTQRIVKKVVRDKFEGLQHQYHPHKCRYENYVKPYNTCYRESKRK